MTPFGIRRSGGPGEDNETTPSRIPGTWADANFLICGSSWSMESGPGRATRRSCSDPRPLTEPPMTTSTTLRQRLRGWPGGVALMIVGVALALGGLLQTTSSTVDTSADCPTGSTLVSKYNFVANSFVFEKPEGN